MDVFSSYSTKFMCGWYISAYVSPKQKVYLDMTQRYNISQGKSNKKRTIACKHHPHYKKISMTVLLSKQNDSHKSTKRSDYSYGFNIGIV